MKTFTFFEGQGPKFTLQTEPHEPLPIPPTPTEVHQLAVVCARRETFHNFREDLMRHNTDETFEYGGLNSFIMGDTEFIGIRYWNDLLGRYWDRFIQLHDANEAPDYLRIMAYLEERGIQERF